MTEYKKKVSGVTSILIRDAHGKNKINHSAWDNELQSESDFSDRSNNSKRRKKRDAINPVWGRVFRIVGALLIIYFWYGVFTGKYNEHYNLLKTFYSEKVASVYEKKQNQITEDNQGEALHASQKEDRGFKDYFSPKEKRSKMPVKIVGKLQESNQLKIPPERLKYKLFLKTGKVVIADDFKIIGDIANYKYKEQNIFINKSDVLRAQELVIDVKK